MNRKNKTVVRWPLLAGYLAMTIVLLACAAGGTATALPTAYVTPIATEAALLRLEDGAVKVKAQGDNTDWLPVAGESTFELVGEVESIDPWIVTGNTFALRETTQIAEGLEVGDLIRVKGIILEDHTWLANSIEPAQEQIDPTIVLIGNVISTDPWVVHGITLNVTADTVITGEITPHMIVLVEILLLEDGTWEVLSITPLSDFTEIPGCATVTARVESVNGNEVEFIGWPAITLDEGVSIEDEEGAQGMLEADQSVLVVVCATEDGQFTITKIILLNTDEDEEDSTDALGSSEKVLICHKPDKKGGHTLRVAAAAVSAHIAHGDKLGACP
ncbi:MAG TPA: DUF5666 domain-containing protein [Anaerolineales bacterium]|nr:DUF5666 domain-containing protein [Anaerolineales bacterium]